MKQEKLWTPEFLSMSGSNFFLFMSQYILVTALPIFIMEQLGGGEMEAGLAMTFFQIGTVVCRPLAGRIIDSVNKRHLLLAATVTFFLIMLGFNLFQNLTSIYGLRLLHGIIFAMTTTATAAMAAIVLPVSRKGEGISPCWVSSQSRRPITVVCPPKSASLRQRRNPAGRSPILSSRVRWPWQD